MHSLSIIRKLFLTQLMSFLRSFKVHYFGENSLLMTVKQNCVPACERLTSGQNIPGDRVGDGCEDPVELSEGSASVIEPARDPATHNTTQMAVSAALTVCHIVYSEDKVATAQYYHHNTSEEIYICT